ncbi:DUF1615 domain-containing protein [Chromobacterium haemolyticum]|uniref:DUF1615 domain-containing protein n=1 Tax=Chromobacterium haemolyticum TaxID=394935 RepID=UPI002448E329|nr:DUF1615 domain-containing protein [Chromobacterium haemolyticum]MDH0341300.1 DUF1615 domain-containing protein [Chromobacterium haemolyticum]
MKPSRLLFALLPALLSACANVSPPAPVAAPVVVAPIPSEPEAPAPAVEAPPSPPPVSAPPLRPAYNDPQAGRLLLNRLLPAKIRDRQGWSNDILSAFTHLKIPYTAENFCALAAVIEQESSWQADPTVPNLPAIVWDKIAERAHGYLIPLPVVKAALMKTSPNGKSYKARIDSLRTEREMNDLFEDMSREASKLGLPMSMKNPIRTGGPMQVSVEFAEGHVKVWPYPYPRSGSIRQEVFTRRGGVYFGAAILLQYPAPYSQMLYRFADFNAGRYSSRNAAFQAVMEKLSGKDLTLDGDLLSYKDGKVYPSTTQSAVISQGGKLGMGQGEILRDLKLEKSAAFGQSELYRKTYALADQRFGKPAPREQLPQIDLKSPKITRKLTTEWFAKRVDGRYQSCLARAR